jgi:hypothetical protein
VLRIHGSLLAISEIILTVSEEDFANESLFQVLLFVLLIQNIQYCLQKLPDYTRKSVHASGVIISSLRFIECICTSSLPVDDTSIQSYIQLIESSFHKPVDKIQQAASEALGALSQRYDISPFFPKWSGNLSAKTNFILRRGWALAFGYLHLSCYDDILELLCNTIENENDIETKRNAIKSVRLIFSKAPSVNGNPR